MCLLLFGIVLAAYVLGYLSLRFSGSITARSAQGQYELEFGDNGLIEAVPESFRSAVLMLFRPLVNMESRLLHFYIPEPQGG